MLEWANMTPEERKHAKLRATALKKAKLGTFGFELMQEALYEMEETCEEITYFYQGDEGLESLVDAMAGDEDDAYEFQMLFSDVSVQCQELKECLRDVDKDWYDVCAVAALGSETGCLGYDSEEMDYFKLTAYESQLAQTRSGEKLMGLTKVKMLSQLGQTWGVVLSFISLKQQFDNLKTSYDFIKGENTSLLKQLDQIDKLYEEAEADGFKEWAESTKKYEKALLALPDRCWIE